MESKEFKNHINLSIVNIILLLFIMVFYLLDIPKLFVTIPLILLGIFNIYYLSKATGIMISPITIFSLIWLIIIPLTSGSAPLMPEMSNMQWKYCLFGSILFFYRGFICWNNK